MTVDPITIRPGDVLPGWPAASTVLVDDCCGLGPDAFDRLTVEMLMREAADLFLSPPVRSRADERSRGHCLLAARCRRERVLYVESGDTESWRSAWRRVRP